MREIISINELRASILLLEIKQADDAKLMKEQLMVTYESMKPINLIKNSIKDFVASPDLKENFLKTTLGLAVGYLSKKVVVGSTHNPLKQLLGTFLQVGVSNMVSNNFDEIKSVSMNLINNFLKKKDTPI